MSPSRTWLGGDGDSEPRNCVSICAQEGDAPLVSRYPRTGAAEPESLTGTNVVSRGGIVSPARCVPCGAQPVEKIVTIVTRSRH
jgi:hypothetical protein